MSITLNQIKYALAVHKTGSFSAAADLCFVTQSTLSTMIIRMEKVLDLELFDRRKKPIALTPEGEKLIAQFKVVHNESKHLNELVLETKNEFSGTLNIGVIPTLAPFLLPLFLNKFIIAYPEVDFAVFEITTDDIIKRIKLRELDVGILSLPITENEMRTIPLFQEEFLVYDSNTEKNMKKKYSVKDIDIERLWLLEERNCLTNQIEKICNLRKKRKQENNLDLKSSSLLTVLNLIRSFGGLTLIPKLATHQISDDIQDNIFPLTSPVPVREVGLIIHENYTKKHILKALGEAIKECVSPILRLRRQTKVINPF